MARRHHHTMGPQFSRRKKDPEGAKSKAHFSGHPGESKTMPVSGGGRGSGLPKPQVKHTHHRSATHRTRRAH